MSYPCSENKGTDQLRGYREADLRLCFRICKKPVFSRRGSYTVHLALCMLGTLHAILSSADIFIYLFKSSGILSESHNRLDPDQARHFVGPDLGPNCLQRLSADDTGKQCPHLPKNRDF